MSRKETVVILRTVAVALIGVALNVSSAIAEEQKITICHLPPGNPATAQRIAVSQNALEAHVAHGDLVLGSSFTFYSGAASASFGTQGEGPTTTGAGAVGANDPITKVGVVQAQIIATNGAWFTIPGTQWISYADTTSNGPADGTVVNFDVDFRIPDIPGCAISPSVTISALGDDEVTAFLNGNQVGPSPLASFTSVGTTATSTGINPGVNTVRFAVTQTGGDGFGLDFRVVVTLD